jgi:sugar lactone lactonase YvrE
VAGRRPLVRGVKLAMTDKRNLKSLGVLLLLAFCFSSALTGDAGEPVAVADIGDTSEGITFSKDGVLYVTSYTKGNIVAIRGDGAQSMYASGLLSPAAIAFDSRENLYVCEWGTVRFRLWTKRRGRVTRITPDGQREHITEIASNDGSKRRSISHPNGIAITSDDVVYFSDSSGFVARVENNEGSVLFSFRNWIPTTGVNISYSPNGMALTEDETTLYVNDAASGDIWQVELDESGKLTGKSKLPLSKPLPYADGIAIDKNGLLYVTYDLKYVAKVTPETGEVVDLYSKEGLRTPANIAFGYGSQFDNQSIYIAQLGLKEKQDASVIKKIFVGTEGMILPPLK